MTLAGKMETGNSGDILEGSAGGDAQGVVAGRKERSDIRKMLLKTLRPLPLMHNWTFWYDRYCFIYSWTGVQLWGRKADGLDTFHARIRQSTMITSLKWLNSTLFQYVAVVMVLTGQDFWRIYNNLPLTISPRDSIHMFKRGVKPRWEDPRNTHGGIPAVQRLRLICRLMDISRHE